MSYVKVLIVIIVPSDLRRKFKYLLIKICFNSTNISFISQYLTDTFISFNILYDMSGDILNISDFRGTFKLLILELLRKEPLHGYALMNKLQEMIGVHKPGSSMIYPKLANLKLSGYLEIIGRENRDKKIYKITKKGIEYLENHQEKLNAILKKIKIFNEFLELGGKEFQKTFKKIIEKFDKLSDKQKKKLSEAMRNSAKEINYIIEFEE